MTSLNVCDFLFALFVLYNEMCQCLDDLHNSANQYLLNDRHVMLKITRGLKNACIQGAGQTNGFSCNRI